MGCAGDFSILGAQVAILDAGHDPSVVIAEKVVEAKVGSDGVHHLVLRQRQQKDHRDCGEGNDGKCECLRPRWNQQTGIGSQVEGGPG